jgi:pyruvate kinase
MTERRAKIMATLGPASSEESVLRELLKVGVDLIRLNLSHGTPDEHRETISRVRRVALSVHRHVPIVLDLMGPRYRLGLIPGDRRMLVAGEVVRLGEAAVGADLPVDDPAFLAHLAPGERVLIDAGLIELTIESREGSVLTARVVNGGPIRSRKGLNLPDSALPFVISPKDASDIAFAVAEGADFLAASFVGEAAHVESIRALALEAGGAIPIIAKLERAAALKHLDEISAAADGVMVARGDLGVEVALATVPVWQKEIIAAARRAGKPVIVATQMLESMIEQPRPTRAEATDVANAVFDGTDALMLSGETTIGRYPVEVVRTMAGIILEAEAYDRRRRPPRTAFRPLGAELVRRRTPLDPIATAPECDPSLDVPDLVSAAAVFAADELGVRRIVAFSQSGFTARLAARYRPEAPIVAFTPDPRVARQLQLVWGVRPLLADGDVEHLDGMMQLVDRKLQLAGLAEPGDRIIVLMGHPIRERPLTNLMRVHRVRSAEEWERLRPEVESPLPREEVGP